MMQAIIKWLEKAPLFILTVPLFIILHIHNEYYLLIRLRFVYVEIIQLVLVPFVILALCYFISRQARKSLVYTFILMLPYYFFCDLKDFLHEKAPDVFISKYSFLLPVVTLVTVYFLWRVRQSLSSFRRLFLFVNVLFILFSFSDLVSILFIMPKNELISRSHRIADKYVACKDCVKPDIYYILFDAYTSSRTLQNEFNYSNKKVDSFLSHKGFYLITNSTSNYNLTPFSIGSIFNLNYLDKLNTSKDFYMSDFRPGVNAVYENEWISILEKEGYKISNLSLFNMKGYPARIRSFDVWDTYLLYKRHHFFAKLDTDLGWMIRSRLNIKGQAFNPEEYRLERDAHLAKTYELLLQTCRTSASSPRFIYTHLLVPHPPLTFDSLGNKLPEPALTVSADEDERNYLMQVIYTNTLLQNAVENILSHAKRPCVIIIQGDHGYKYLDPEKSELEFPNMNAMYFYDGDYHLLNKKLSSVNTFRIIMNTFFKKSYPLLQDTSYFLHYK